MNAEFSKASPAETGLKTLHLLGQDADNGGIITVLRNLQVATSVAGDRHVVLVNRNFVEARRPPLDYRYSRHFRDEATSQLALLLGALGGVAALRRLLREESFDILHAHSRGGFLLGLFAAALLRRTVLFTNHAYGRRTGLYRRATSVPRFYTTVLTPNMARHYGIEVRPPKISIVSECCADSFFTAPLAENAVRREPGDPLRIVGVGNVVRWKNWHLLLEALNSLGAEERSRMCFTHWGGTVPDPESHRYHAELMRRVGSSPAGASVTFGGPVFPIEPKLRAADWLAMPSTNEPCSVAIIEAMALGMPVIASASGGNVDIVCDGVTGALFKPDDAADLAAKIRDILTSRLRPVAPARIRESVRLRSAGVVAAQYRALYTQLCTLT